MRTFDREMFFGTSDNSRTRDAIGEFVGKYELVGKFTRLFSETEGKES